jgi:hypothetical protein
MSQPLMQAPIWHSTDAGKEVKLISASPSAAFELTEKLSAHAAFVTVRVSDSIL